MAGGGEWELRNGRGVREQGSWRGLEYLSSYGCQDLPAALEGHIEQWRLETGGPPLPLFLGVRALQKTHCALRCGEMRRRRGGAPESRAPGPP